MNGKIEQFGPLQAKRDKYFALLGIGKLSDKQLAEMQKLARKIVKADVKEEKKRAKKQAVTEKDQLLYEARRDETELALSSLRRALPATAKLVDDFERALAAAKPLADGGTYAEALKALKAVDPAKATAKRDELWTDAQTAAAKLAPEAFASIRQINAALAGKELPLPADEVRRFRSETTRLGRPLLVKKPAREEIDDATRGLADLLAELSKAIEDGRAAWQRTELLRAETSRVLNRIAPLSGDEPPLLTDREVAPMRLALASAGTSLAACNFEAARQVLEPLLAELGDVEARIGPLRKEWAQRQGVVRPRWVEAQKLAAEAMSPQVKEDASALAASLDELLTQGVGRGVGFPDAIDRVDDAEDLIAQLKALDAQWQAFHGLGGSGGGAATQDAADLAQGIEPAKKRIDAYFREIATALERLHGAVAKATGGRHKRVGDSRFAERRDAAKAEWDARVERAHDVASLDEAGMRAQLIALRDDIVDAVDDDQLLDAVIETGRLDRARGDYQRARDAAREACERFAALDVDAGADLLDEIEAICDGVENAGAATAAAYRKAVGRLERFAKQAQEGETARAEAVRQAQEQLASLLEPVPARLAELKALAEKAKSGQKQQPLVALLDMLQGTLNALRVRQKLTHLPLLQEAIAEATTFVDEVEDSVDAAMKRGDIGGSMSFGEARKMIGELKGELEDKDCKLYRVNTQFKLSERLKSLEKGLGTTTMSRLSAELGALATEVEAMKRAAADAKQRTKQFESSVVAGLKKKLEAKAFKDAPDYVKSMTASIKSLVDDYRFEGGEEAAIQKAAQIERELTDVLQGEVDTRGVPKALAAKQSDAEKTKNDKIVEKGKWDGESKVLAERLKALRSINPGEIQALEDSLDSARSSVKASEDFASGRNQLQSIRNRLALIEANPRGLAITARNKLPQVNRRVKAAFAGLVGAIDAVDKAVTQLPDAEVDAPGKRAVSTQLAALRGLFNANVFDDAVAKMAAKSLVREVRSGAREQALREVRRLQAYLNHDARLRLLAETPFVPGMPSVLSELALALLDLENNLLVSI